MSWQRNYVDLQGGKRVRYTLLHRSDQDSYLVRFRDRAHRRVERSTGEKKIAAAREAAHAIILSEFGEQSPELREVSWKQAEDRLEAEMTANKKRPRTIEGYQETLRRLKEAFPKAKGPSDISEDVAADFKLKYSSNRFSRSSKPKAKEYPRRAKSVDSRIRTLKAVFGWFESFGYIESNPFEEVSPPKLDKTEVRYIRKSDVAAFFTWLDARYGSWDMPRIFFMVKALTGCRLNDICQLPSSALRDGMLVFPSHVTKNRGEREAPLPAEVFARLKARRGKQYLWENYPTELLAANKAKGFMTHKQNTTFSPRRLYLWVVQLLRQYERETGADLSSHDFRRAAFTRAAEKSIHPKMAAVAFDVTADTMLRYYTATDKRQTAKAVLPKLASDLVPKIA